MFHARVERSFTLADIAALDAAKLTKREARTLERMGVPTMGEVRPQLPDQWIGGRIAYDMGGNEADSVLPGRHNRLLPGPIASFPTVSYR